MNKRTASLAKRIIKKIFNIEDQTSVEALQKKGLVVGRNFQMQENCSLDFSHSWHITIGDDVTLAPNVTILAHDASTKIFMNYTKVRNVVIGNCVFVGAGSIIMPGVTIGNNVIIGAGSIVLKDVPDNAVYAGNPARFIINTDEYIIGEQNKMSPGNQFGREFSEANGVSSDKKQQIKTAAATHGTAYIE
jgi:maltose O-acetyltransferase